MFFSVSMIELFRMETEINFQFSIRILETDHRCAVVFCK